jgi:ABC-type transporter lipoprotein component MlaA
MSFTTLLRPRKQVLSEEGIAGIIDVATAMFTFAGDMLTILGKVLGTWIEENE